MKEKDVIKDEAFVSVQLFAGLHHAPPTTTKEEKCK